MTPFEQHVKDWQNCRRCPLHTTRKKVVLARGKIPAQVLMVAEAPGISEDAIGSPLIGPAGKLLDEIIADAIKDSGYKPTIAFTNLVGCIPKAPDTKRKKEEPTAYEIERCAPRLEEMFNLVKPKLVVAVGALSEKQATIGLWAAEYQVVGIVHPAFLLRLDIGQQGLMIQRTVVQLSDAFASLQQQEAHVKASQRTSNSRAVVRRAIKGSSK